MIVDESSESESSGEDYANGDLFFSKQTNLESKSPLLISSTGKDLLDKVKELAYSQQQLSSIEFKTEQPLDQFSQDSFDTPFLEGQFVFDQVEFSPFTISRPFIADQDIKENEYLNDIRCYFDAACEGISDSLTSDRVSGPFLPLPASHRRAA